MNPEVEIEIFKFFIDKNRRKRFEWHLSDVKRRHKIFNDLRDTRYFDESKVTEIDGPEKIIQFLKTRGFSKGMYVVSSDEELDGKVVSVAQMEESNFWEPEEIIGFSKSKKIGFFKNHEDWYYLIE